MTDLDRYNITCPVHHQRDCSPLLNGCTLPSAIRAALPGILAQHRADVLREAADMVEDPDLPSPVAYLRRLADKAVPGGR